MDSSIGPSPAALLTLMSKFFPPLSCLEVLTDQGNKFQLQSLICVRRVFFFFPRVSPLGLISRGRSWSSRRRWRVWESRSASLNSRERQREGNLAAAFLLPRIPTPEKEETANLFLPAARKGTDLGRHRELRSVWWGARRASACVRPSREYMREGRAGSGRRGWRRSGGAHRAAC